MSIDDLSAVREAGWNALASTNRWIAAVRREIGGTQLTCPQQPLRRAEQSPSATLYENALAWPLDQQVARSEEW